MNNNISKRSIMVASVYVLLFVVYNIVLFAISGFVGHGPSFWISYVFIILAFIAFAISVICLQQSKLKLRDWILGYPLLKHGIIYIILEFFVSIIFMIIDMFSIPWGIPFSVQMIIFAVYCIFAVSCFLSKEEIEEIQNKVEKSTENMRVLQMEAEIVSGKANEPATKKAFADLADNIRFSNSVSTSELSPIEDMILEQIKNAEYALLINNDQEALICCQKANELLNERNIRNTISK